MALVWNWFGLANVLASALLLVLGLLFIKARRGEFTLAFAAYCVLAGGQKLTGGVALYFAADAATRDAWLLVSTAFLAASTPTLVHALAAFTWPGRMRRTPVAAKAAIYAPFALAPALVLTRPVPFSAVSLAFAVVFMAILAVFLVPVALRAYRGPTAVGRLHSRYMLAYLAIALSFSLEARVIFLLYGTMPWWELSMAYMVATGILLYGILRTHLFDVDLKVKFALRQSTVAAVIVAAFFVVSELAAALLTDQIGTVLGILAAGVLVLAIAPLQRLAGRLSDRAMPGVESTDAYLSYRKLQVYRAAVEAAMEDGVVTARERRVLDGLRQSLGVAEADAAALERDAAAPPAR